MRPWRRRRPALLALAAVLALVLWAGAGSVGAQDDALADAQEAEDTASLRVLHLSPDAPLVDVLVDGRLTFRDVDHRDRTEYVPLAAGRHEVRVYPHRLPDTTADEPDPGEPDGSAEAADAGGDAPEDDEDGGGEESGANGENGDGPTARPLEPVVALLDLEPGSYTTVVLTGNFQAPTVEGGLGQLGIEVDPPDAQVTVRGPRGYLAQRRGEQLLADLEPGTYEVEVQREGYQTAQYQVEVRPGGTAVATLTLQAADDEDGDDAGELLQEQTEATWQRLELQPYQGDLPLAGAGRALVRFVHVAPSIPHLGVSVVPLRGDEAEDEDEASEGASPADPTPDLSVERLTYPNSVDYQAITAGRRQLEFRIAGTDSVLHDVPDVDFRAGASYTLYLAADPEGGRVDVVPVVDAYLPQRPAAPEEP